MSERDLFLAALDIENLDDRKRFLGEHCGADEAKRLRLQQLLLAKSAAGSFLESPASGLTPADQTCTFGDPEATNSLRSVASAEEAEGTVIAGRYKLRQQIGEGGMGAVWMADQTEPVKRKVAVKLIRVERGQSKTILARFEAERQAIALMDHPHIAKLLDAGTTETGSPFFVMELVKGIPLSDFCDQHKLTIAERLNLFTQICSAVQHAHQKGIIHRDLKPSNILVESHDGKPVPKVIDFGLAKATTGLQLSEQSMFTAFGSVMGTPLYMAPEQATFNAVDVDTRADVYALGVVLYELLTGTTPLTKETMKKAALDEMLRLVREQEAPTPSSRLSSADSTPSVAASRQMEPLKLGRFVKGELDWIVLKALSKDRDRRYETANGFAKDIERFLNHEPVTAGPPSARYRLQKFVQRNRGQVIAASLVLLALVAGVVGTSVGLYQANLARDSEAQQRQLAETNERTANTEKANAERAAATEKLARQEEEHQRKFAEAIAQFVKDDFLGLTSVEGQARFGGDFGSKGLDGNATLMTLLDRAATKLKARKDLDPRIEAELCWIVGVNYRGAGEAAKGVPFLERAVELMRKTLGPDNPNTLESMNSLAVGYSAAGQIHKALPLHEETFTLRKAKLGHDHPKTLDSMGNLAGIYEETGLLDKSMPLFEEALKLKKAKLGHDNSSTLRSMDGLADCYLKAGLLDKAMPLNQETLKLRKDKLGPDHPDTLRSMNNLALVYDAAGQRDKALPLFEETLKLCKAKFGPDHPDTLRSMAYLGTGYRDAGQLDKALPLLEETLKLCKAKLGPDHPDTLRNMLALALGQHYAGQTDKALLLNEVAFKLFKAKLGPNHPDTLKSMVELAQGYYRSALQIDKALPLGEEALQLMKAKLGPGHPATITSMSNLALYYQAAGQLEKALPLHEESLMLWKAKLGPDHPYTLTSMGNLALYYQAAGQLDKALPLYEETLKLRKTKLGPDHPDTLKSMNDLALGYRAAGQLDKYLPLHEETLKLRKAKLGPDHPDTIANMKFLGVYYWRLKWLEKSVPLFEELYRLQEKKHGRAHPDTLGAVGNLGVNYKDAGRVAEAIPLLEEAYRASNKHPFLRGVSEPLLDAYVKAGKPAEAAKLIDEMLADARKTIRKDSPQLAGQLAQFGLSLLEMKGYAEAEPLLRECLTIREKTQPDAWTTFNTQSLLGGALLGLKKYADAKPLLLKGYEGMKAREKTIPPQAATRIPEALDRLIELYTATNKPDEVKKYQELRTKYPKPKEVAPMPKEKK